MRQFNINDGVGHPFRQDDLQYMQEALEQATKGLTRITNLDSFFIDGAEITEDTSQNQYDITDGWMVYQGEIMKVESHVISNQLSSYTWAVVESNPGSKLNGNNLVNPLTYEDGSTVYVYKERKMEYQEDVGQSEQVKDPKRMDITNWQDPVFQNNWQHGTPLLLYRRHLGHLEIVGEAVNNDPGNWSTPLVFELPSAYAARSSQRAVFYNLNANDIVEGGTGLLSSAEDFFLTETNLISGNTASKLQIQVNFRYPLF